MIRKVYLYLFWKNYVSMESVEGQPKPSPDNSVTVYLMKHFFEEIFCSGYVFISFLAT